MPVSYPSGVTKARVFLHGEHGSAAPILVGQVSIERPREGHVLASFEYSKRWLSNPKAFPIDPVNLPLQSGRMQTFKNHGMHGVLSDATPDRWGRRLLRRQFEPKSEIDWLLVSGEDRVGALGFSTERVLSTDGNGAWSFDDLEMLEKRIALFDAGEETEDDFLKLARGAGGSLGGARPKTVIRIGDELWIAKFPLKSDDIDVSAAEHAAMTLAAECGIDVAETRTVTISGKTILLVRRFDRAEDGGRLHYISARSIVDRQDTDTDGSYIEIADRMRLFCPDPRRGLYDLYARMAFNLLTGNTDDHLKNHGFLMKSGAWQLSPAFDILPQVENNGMQAISIGKFGPDASIRNCLSMSERFGLSTDDASALIARLKDVVRGWREHFSACGVSQRDIKQLEHCFRLASDERKETPSSVMVP